MASVEQPRFTLDDEEGGRLQLAWSPSGRMLAVSVSDRNWGDLHHMGLRPHQIERLIEFLSRSLADHQAET